jgi:hypothetical protein
MARFNLEDATAADPDQLLSQVLGSSSHLHQPYLGCASTRRGPRIHCLHLPSRFASALDGHVTPWDNQCYLFLGEVTQEIITTATFPANAFTTTTNNLVYHEEYILNNLQAFNGVVTKPLILCLIRALWRFQGA